LFATNKTSSIPSSFYIKVDIFGARKPVKLKVHNNAKVYKAFNEPMSSDLPEWAVLKSFSRLFLKVFTYILVYRD